MAAAAYQSGEKLHSQFTGTWEYGRETERIDYTEILLPPNAPREYANRETLWNAVDTAETGENAQTARRFIIALPKELTLEQNIALIRRYCQTTFVDKGMIADIAVHHSLPDGNPHAHILLTMRAMDDHGKWLPKSKNTYALDEHGNRIIGKNGKPKRIKVDTVDWNDQGNCERWRHEWEIQQNAALEQAGRPERIDMRSLERQGIERAPQKHLGPAASALEKQGIRTELGNHNQAVKLLNGLFSSVKRKLKSMLDWLAELQQAISDQATVEKSELYSVSQVLMSYINLRKTEREDWHRSAQTSSLIRDLKEVQEAIVFLQDYRLETVGDIGRRINAVGERLRQMTATKRANEQRVRDIEAIIQAVKTLKELTPVQDKLNSIFFKGARAKYESEHANELAKLRKSQRLLHKLNITLPINSRELNAEARRLKAETEAMLPELEAIHAEMDQLKQVRRWVRKVMPDALPIRHPDERTSISEARERDLNRRELEGVMERAADQVCIPPDERTQHQPPTLDPQHRKEEL